MAAPVSIRNASRRQVMTCALVAPFIGAVAAVAGPVDPIHDLVARHAALLDACPDDGCDGSSARWLKSVRAFERTMAAARPTTRAGAFAAARYALSEIGDPDGGEWAHALLDNALTFLEQEMPA